MSAPEEKSVECRLIEGHASQEEVGYLPSIHYVLWKCNLYENNRFVSTHCLLKRVEFKMHV